ncbi:hypothetical protein FN846DRAFT_988954 [Sphaerosporella brunnea]|uniref:XPG-I domain-containing protein n=1 Tax=Sphaerosporella brunnea TaxID=1250544 RepID=A0A5J5EQQ9_9PEZI|nr:hypothetical protein FN846DRAFT_988954 [Sphaerosporella brunnea]
MGIPGLYAELGPGERVSLAKYAAEHYTRTGRRLRLAVDASIWSFQVQSGKGGSNPALRTVYYRILRLLSHNITPLFVFDGPHRPSFKRGNKTNTQLTPSLVRLSKKLLKLFGCPFHTAPGEAEAECALLNREGIVDAVLSEDVDTLMFGAKVVIRKWSSEGKSNTPTHVTCHRTEKIDKEIGITREGMVLIALMRGGDYLPEGVPGCGIKTAVEAAKAGFGKDLFAVRNDEGRLAAWRDRLRNEMATNKSGYFKRRNGKAVVPAGFPNQEILGYYAEPAVSDAETVERLREAIDWNAEVDAVALREYARDTFEWRGPGGAAKFVRTLAPVLLAKRVWNGDLDTCKLISALHGRRDHVSTDGLQEIRISYTPVEVVPIDKALEEEDEKVEAQEQAGVLDDDDAALMNDGEGGTNWDPYMPERIWVLEALLARGIQDRIEEYDNAKAAKTKPKTTTTTTARKTTTKTTTTKSAASKDGMAQSSMDRYVKASKSGAAAKTTKEAARPAASRPVTKPQAPTFATTKRTERTVPSTTVGKSAAPAKVPFTFKDPIARSSTTQPKPKTNVTKRLEPSRLITSPAAPRAASVASQSKTSRPASVAASSPIKSAATSKATTSLQTKRVVSAAVNARKPTVPKTTKALKQPVPPAEKPHKRTEAPPLRINTQQPEAEVPLDTQQPATIPSVERSGSPVEGLAKRIEAIDLTTPTPARPSTPEHLQIEQIQQQSPLNSVARWIESTRLANSNSPPYPVSPLQIRRPLVERTPPPRRQANGTVAALMRNFETISISSSPAPASTSARTPLPPATTTGTTTSSDAAPTTPIKLVAPPADPDAVQNSPFVEVKRRGKVDGKSLEEDMGVLKKSAGNMVVQQPQPQPAGINIALKEWVSGGWEEVQDGERSGAWKVLQGVEVVDLTGA